MFFWQAGLFFLFIEAFALFAVIRQVGFFTTFLLWLACAIIGSTIIQRQGMAAIMRVQNVLNRGAVPVDDLFDGICLVIAGLLFIMPGFIGDVLAVFLLIPRVRAFLRTNNPVAFGARTSPFRTSEDGVIDGTSVRVEDPVEFIEQKPDNDSKIDF